MLFVRPLTSIAFVLVLVSGCTQVPTVVTAPAPSSPPAVPPSVSPNIQKVLDDFDSAKRKGEEAKREIDREYTKTQSCIAKKERAAYPNQPPLTAECKQRLAALDAPKKQPQKP